MEEFFTLPFIMALLIAVFRIAPPLLLAATGELVSENGGMLNIGLEGIMSVGAILGFIVGNLSGSPYLGMLAGVIGGMLFNLIYAYSTIKFHADQIIVGTAMNIIGIALSSYLYKTCMTQSSLLQAPQAALLSIPLLSNIPFVGPILFNQSLLGYLSILLAVAMFVFLYKTRVGLSLRAVGEYPKAAETLGINVIQRKYMACILCGALAGLAGAYLTTTYVQSFNENIVSGRGYIALAAVIFGRWRPSGVFGACFLFAILGALQMRLQSANSAIPYQLLLMMPYVITLLAMAFFMKTGTGPKSVGLPYVRD